MDAKEKGIMLLSTTVVSLAGVAQTTLYVVPKGKRCVLVMAIITLDVADAGASEVTIGEQGSATDFLNTQTLSALDAQYDAGILQPIPNATTVLVKSYAAEAIIEIDVTNADGNATNTVYLFGFLY